MVACCVSDCHYKHKNKSSGKTVYRFPFSRPEILKKWIKNVNRRDWAPIRTSVICSDHFEKDCFRNKEGNILLEKDAIPTIFGERNILKRRILEMFETSETAKPDLPKISSDVKKVNLENLKNESKLSGETSENNSTPAEPAIDKTVLCHPVQNVNTEKPTDELKLLASVAVQNCTKINSCIQMNNLHKQTYQNNFSTPIILQAISLADACETQVNLKEKGNIPIHKQPLFKEVCKLKKKLEHCQKLNTKYRKELKTKQQTIRRLQNRLDAIKGKSKNGKVRLKGTEVFTLFVT